MQKARHPRWLAALLLGLIALAPLPAALADAPRNNRTLAAPRAPAYTVEMVREHTERVAESRFTQPTASGGDNFVIGRSRGWPGNPRIPPHDLYAYRISCPGAEGEREIIILVSGNHNTEHTGSWALQGAIDYLLSDAPEADALRRAAAFYVYPMVNPDGRYTLRGRGNPELTAAGIGDHNRAWNTVGRSTTIDIVRNAIRRDPRRPAAFLFDFHSAGRTMLYVTEALSGSPFVRALAARDEGIDIVIRPGVPSMLRIVAMDPDGMNVAQAYTPELARHVSAERSQEVGRHYMLALYDVLVGEGAEAEELEAVGVE